MPSLAEIKTDGALKILVYGDPGSGKTCFAAGFPTPILYLDFDCKVDSAALFYRKDTVRLQAIDVRQLGSNLAVNPIQELEKIIASELVPQQKSGQMKFKTLVLDSLTSFSSACLRYIVESNPGINRVKTKQGAQPGMQDFGILKREFKKLIPGLLDLPCNIVMCGHVATEKDEATGQIIRGALMDGSFANELPSLFKEAWRTCVDDKGQHWAQTRPDSKFSKLRSQIPGLPSLLPLNYAALEKFIK